MAKLMSISANDEFKRFVKQSAHKHEMGVSEFIRKCVYAYKCENWSAIVEEVEKEMGNDRCVK